MIVECKDYEKLCDYTWEKGQGRPKSGVVHVACDHIAAFFREIAGLSERYVVVSPSSDFGPALQSEHGVWRDASKWLNMQSSEELGYNDIRMETRCNRDRCKLTDKYSVKCYSFTIDTFPEIPPNVDRWYCCNNMLENDRITSLPFGIAEGSRELVESIPIKNTNDRSILLYVNFQHCTWERFILKSFFRQYPWAKIVDAPVSHEEYLRDISNSKFVLSPQGNGTDCYRTWEAIALHTIPIVQVSYPTIAFARAGLPVMVCKDYLQLTEGVLRSISIENALASSSNEYAQKEYWGNLLLS